MRQPHSVSADDGDAAVTRTPNSALICEDLAGRLGLKKQHVQRYAATRSAGVSLEHRQAGADALGVTIHEQVTLSVIVGDQDADSGEPFSAYSTPCRTRPFGVLRLRASR